MLENSPALSTFQITYSRRRYVSADDAVGEYVRALTLIDGAPAIDYAKPLVQSAASPENPALNAIDDVLDLQQVFALTRARVKAEHWVVWCERRVNQRPFGEMHGVASRTARRWVEYVDAKVEQELAERGLLVRSVMRMVAA